MKNKKIKIIKVSEKTHKKMKIICAKESWTMDFLIRVLLDNAK